MEIALEAMAIGWLLTAIAVRTLVPSWPKALAGAVVIVLVFMALGFEFAPVDLVALLARR